MINDDANKFLHRIADDLLNARQVFAHARNAILGQWPKMSEEELMRHLPKLNEIENFLHYLKIDLESPTEIIDTKVNALRLCHVIPRAKNVNTE